jgi:hypothetical protein
MQYRGLEVKDRTTPLGSATEISAPSSLAFVPCLPPLTPVARLRYGILEESSSSNPNPTRHPVLLPPRVLSSQSLPATLIFQRARVHRRSLVKLFISAVFELRLHLGRTSTLFRVLFLLYRSSAFLPSCSAASTYLLCFSSQSIVTLLFNCCIISIFAVRFYESPIFRLDITLLLHTVCK